MEILYTKTYNEAKIATENGFTPIECSFGNEGSVIDDYTMDHHGIFSDLSSVAFRAYHYYWGEKRNNPLFCVTGEADADATFAICAMIGMIESTPKWDKLVDLIARVDVDPIGIDLLQEGKEGLLLMFWNSLTNGKQDKTQFEMGCGLWRHILNNVPLQYLVATKEQEKRRRLKAWDTPLIEKRDKILTISNNDWAFDIWYGRLPEQSSNEIEGWKYPIVISYNKEGENITIGCPNKEVAAKCFGVGGLKNIYPKLGKGWGGREAIGGSPRDQKYTWEETKEISKFIM